MLFLGLAVLGVQPAWADDDPGTVVSELIVAAKPQATPLSGVDIVVARPKATSLPGVDVSPPNKCLAPRNPPDATVAAPKLVSSYPAKGAIVRPGLLVLRLTFDLPMACRGALGIDLPRANPCPGATQTWVLSYDRLNLRMLCRVGPKGSYGVWVNRRALQKFQGLGGRTPDPNELVFETSSEPEVTTVAEAVAQDPAFKAPGPTGTQPPLATASSAMNL